MKMKKKILLMGKSGVGKTSIRSIIFAKYVAADTNRLGATIDVEYSQVRFLGNLILHIWDCGGQKMFMDTYFSTQCSAIFSNVELLIYVFDVKSTNMANDVIDFKKCIDKIFEFNREAKIYVLIHKIDLIKFEPHRQEIIDDQMDFIETLLDPVKVKCFGTSIWNDTLYTAWSTIVQSLIPSEFNITPRLNQLLMAVDASEIILFERSTMLVIARSDCESIDNQRVSQTDKMANPSCRSDSETQNNPNSLDSTKLTSNVSSVVDCEDHSLKTKKMDYDNTSSESDEIKRKTSKSKSCTNNCISSDGKIEDKPVREKIYFFYGRLCRTEKITSILKVYQLHCSSIGFPLNELHFVFQKKIMHFSYLTENIFILIILDKNFASKYLIKTNIRLISEHFKDFEEMNC
ncbi:Ras-related GTP-binding protein A [Intoshia linei]|uniref:Ras-related GTP-binding protein A n=1 Tax=Intoshia linei TaxID=1819745 RepID=A0A177AT21_9BILA|nr:Ras-related GTP-binding protein A [Intoshia linei]